MQSKAALRLVEIAEHPLKDEKSDAKIDKLLLSFHHSIITDAKTQPSPIDAFKFLNEIPVLCTLPALKSHEALL